MRTLIIILLSAICVLINAQTTIGEGQYYIKSQLEDKSIDVQWGKNENGVGLHLWDFNGGEAQEFTIVPSNEPGYYYIRTKWGRVLDVSENNPNSGATLHTYDYYGNDNQKWQFISVGNGFYNIRSKLGTYIDVKNGDSASGALIWMATYSQWNNNAAQRWKLQPFVKQSNQTAQWAKAVNGVIPNNAFVAATLGDGRNLYVARSSINGGLHIGKAVQGAREAFIPFGGEEKKVLDYEVLLKGEYGFQWRKMNSGIIPRGSVQGGYEANRNPFYVARAKINNELTIGKIKEGSQAWFPWGGKEYQENYSEILVFPVVVVAPKQNVVSLTFYTGGDDLRGGAFSQVDATLLLKGGQSVRLENIAKRENWPNFSVKTVSFNIDRNIWNEDITGVRIVIVDAGEFGLTRSTDNWDLDRIKVETNLDGLRKQVLDIGTERTLLFRFTGDNRVKDFLRNK